MKNKLLFCFLYVFLIAFLGCSCFNKKDAPSNSDNTILVEDGVSSTTSKAGNYSFITSILKYSFSEFKELNNNTIKWGLKHNIIHEPPEVPENLKELIAKYSGYYIGDTSSKVIYLTFDEGYENGYTSLILDVLKKQNIKAVFFVTKPYIVQNKDLINRMIKEGHIVGNHSTRHPSMPTKTSDISLFNQEFFENERAFYEATGVAMPRYFRPPMGEFSEKSLYLTQKLGYKTIFWSFAYEDWDINKQPNVDASINKILTRSHNGEIMLLHSVSKTNAEVLDKVLSELKSTGYRFGELSELK